MIHPKCAGVWRTMKRVTPLERGVYTVFMFVGCASLLITWRQLAVTEAHSELKLWHRSPDDVTQLNSLQQVPPDVAQFWRENLDWSHLQRRCGGSEQCEKRKLCSAQPQAWTECGLKLSLSHPNQARSEHGTLGVFVPGTSDLPVDVFNWTLPHSVRITVMQRNCSVLDTVTFLSATEAEGYISQLPSFRIVFGVAVGMTEDEMPWKSYHWFPIQNDTHFFAWFTSGGTISAETVRQPYRRQSLHYRAIPFGVRYNITFDMKHLNNSLKMQRGSWAPKHCTPRWHVAIIIPYRDRAAHLNVFLKNIIPFLQKQLLKFTIFLMEQTDGVAFNRGALLNAGFAESRRIISNIDCFVFHDVDLIPEDLSNLYACASKVRSLVTGRRHRRYTQYGGYMGGATSFIPQLFEDINGYSNKFYGWGGEDDNARHRVKKSGLKMMKVPWEIGRFTMLQHADDSGNPRVKNMKVLGSDVLPEVDGLHTTNYEVKSISYRDHFIRILVDIPGPDT